MESDELYIKSNIGKRTPFTTPPGYFENLQETIIKDVEAKTKSRRNKMWIVCRNYVATAACIVIIASAVAAICMNKYPDSSTAPHELAGATHIDGSSDVDNGYIDYTMLDNDDIYSLLASN